MASFRQQLLDDFDRDLRRGAQLVFDEFVDLVRRDDATPRNTGSLAAGIEADRPRFVPGRASTTVRSTYRSGGADVGTILDRSTGRQVEAVSYGHKAFGPISPPLSGGREFIRSFRVTTKHVGWWDEATRQQQLDRASDQLSKVEL